MVLVEIQGRVFNLRYDGTFEETEGTPSIVVLRSNDIDAPLLQDYSRRGIKVFLCDESIGECITKLLRALFPTRKTCKFQ